MGNMRNLYTEEEDEKLVRFLLKNLREGNEHALAPAGNELWRLAESRAITQRSYQSMRDRSEICQRTRRKNLSKI